MKDDIPHRAPRGPHPTTAQRTRRLSLASRVRGRVRRGADLVLGAHAFWSAAFVLVALSIVAAQRCAQGVEPLAVGQIASRDIRATYDVDVVDEALTEERRRAARDEILDVYVHDSGRRLQLSQALSAIFAQARQAAESAVQSNADPAAAVRQRIGTRVATPLLELLLRRNFDLSLERTLTSAVTGIMGDMIIGNKALLEREPAIVLVELPRRRARRLEDYAAIIDLDLARRRLEAMLRERLPARAERELLVGFTSSFIDANLYLDSEATYQRREAAAAAVPPVLVRVAGGELLIRKGERITEETLERLDAARERLPRRLGPAEGAGLIAVLCALAFFVQRYSRFQQRGFHKLQHLHALLVLILLSMALLTQAILWVAGEVADNLPPPFDGLSGYHYLIPLGAGAILVNLLANGRIATVYSAFAAVLFGVIRGADFYLALWALIVQLGGVYAISSYRERAALLRAGLIVGGVGAAAVLAVETLRNGLDPPSRGLYGAGLAFVGGALGVGLLISFSLPVLEWLFNVLTDVRLLELSNLNTPLLSEMAVRAPGSYNHSLVLGTLAEEGAKAIGANSLFCRVAAFYHDIGKMNHPEYYVENQRGTNPHDRLAPSMSALIISSHVKDGIRMAREAGLPEQIVDIIPQHHGTKKMTYFFEKARQLSSPSAPPVQEDDFRYPGPKPQTREAAIFMLADAVEAAARTVDDASPSRLREMIRKLTGSIVLDGQLDECDLTFADLERIQEAFLRLLLSMYHRRVDYPGFEFGRARGAVRQAGATSERRAGRGV